MSAAVYVEQFPATATPEALMAADAKRPGGHWIFDGNPPKDGHEGGFEIERYHPISVGGAIVVLAPSKPPFGEWEQLAEWPD